MHSLEKNSSPVLFLNTLPLFPLMKREFIVDQEANECYGLEATDLQRTIEYALANNQQQLVIVSRISTRETTRKFHYRNFKETQFAKIGLLINVQKDHLLSNKFVFEGLERVLVSNFRRIDNHKNKGAVIWASDYQIISDLVSEESPHSIDLSVYLSNLPSQNENLTPFSQQFKEIKELGFNDINSLVYSNIYNISESSSMTLLTRHFRQSVLEELSLLARINLSKEYIAEKEQFKKKVVKKVSDRERSYKLVQNLKLLLAEIRQQLHDLGAIDEDEGEQANDLITNFLKDPLLPRHVFNAVNDLYQKYKKNFLDAGYGQFSSEANVARQHLEQICKLPWYQTTNESNDLKKARQQLDSNHFGLQKVKDLIIEYLAVIKRIGNKQTTEITAKNGTASGIICLVGAPGIGKTSLITSIANSLNRKFVRINLAGVSDEADVRGHRRTYVASYPGRIIKAMQEAGTINPVILLDEIDKISANSLRGDVASSLLEVLDYSQNSNFVDNYLGDEIKYDLSKVLFVCTANSLEGISTPLLDRMEVIELAPYTFLEKLQIAKDYLLPKNLALHKLTTSDLLFAEGVLEKIITEYCSWEGGVRKLDRLFKKIIRKVILQKEDRSLASHQQALVTLDNLKWYLKNPSIDPSYTKTRKDSVGQVNGLAYTSYGGNVLAVEASFSPGKGIIKITGQLGETIRESAEVALNYIRSHLAWKLPSNFFQSHDFHINFPGGSSKDGPSAGIAITTALLSAIYQQKVPADLAMTGEINLYGGVMPIGGLREKLTSAVSCGIKRVFCPALNLNDSEELPKEVYRENDPSSPLQLFFVENYQQILEYIFPELNRKLLIEKKRSFLSREWFR